MERGTLRARCEAGKPRRPRLRACVGAGSEHRKKTGPHFGGQIFERFGRRTSRPEQRSQLPQRRNLGFCDDGAPGQDGVFGLRRKTLRAEQRFGESALHFVLQQGERVLSGRPWRSRVGGSAKSGADPHEARSAHDRRRANCERGEASEELTPRDDKRTHRSQSPALADEYTRQLHSANADHDDGAHGSRLPSLSSVRNSSSIVGLRGHPKSGELEQRV